MARKEAKLVLISGRKIVEEFSSPIRTLIALGPEAQIKADEKIVVSPEILKKITGFEERDGIAAVVDLPKEASLEGKQYLLVLDQLADPGNLGTLLRTALALGWEGVIVTPGTVDLFNDKALRAGRGATFRLPFAEKTEAELEQFLAKRTVLVADLSGEPLEKVAVRLPVALVLSNEAKGPKFWARNMGKKVSIPMQEGVESLNVAVAGAIFLHGIKAR